MMSIFPYMHTRTDALNMNLKGEVLYFSIPIIWSEAI